MSAQVLKQTDVIPMLYAQTLKDLMSAAVLKVTRVMEETAQVNKTFVNGAGRLVEPHTHIRKKK